MPTTTSARDKLRTHHRYHHHHYESSAEDELVAFHNDARFFHTTSVTIESSEIVEHGEMKGGSRITYPTYSTCRKQQKCIHKLKTLSQKHVADICEGQQQHETQPVTSSTPTLSHPSGAGATLLPPKKNQSSILQQNHQTRKHGADATLLHSKEHISSVLRQDHQPNEGGPEGVPVMISSDDESTIVSPTYETFSAAAGLRSKHSRGHDKKPMPIYQFIAELVQHASKSVSCIRSMNPVSACAAVGSNGNYQYHPYHSHRYHGDHPYDRLRRQADMWDDFDASTFDSIMSDNNNDNKKRIVLTTKSFDEPTLDERNGDFLEMPYTETYVD